MNSYICFMLFTITLFFNNCSYENESEKARIEANIFGNWVVTSNISDTTIKYSDSTSPWFIKVTEDSIIYYSNFSEVDSMTFGYIVCIDSMTYPLYAICFDELAANPILRLDGHEFIFEERNIVIPFPMKVLFVMKRYDGVIPPLHWFN